MTEESKLKLLRKKLEEYEKDQGTHAEQRDSVIEMGRIMMKMIAITGGQKGRTQILDAAHDALTSLMTIYPIDLNKMIVADLANEHAMRDNMFETLGGIMDLDEIPGDIKERLEAVGVRRDKQRMDGIRRLQAFLKIRPALVQAFRDQGIDVSGIPGAVEHAAYQKAATRQSGEEKN